MKLIEVIGGLLILMVVMPTLLSAWNNGFLETQKRQAADHLALVNRASAGYVRKHQTTLLTQATATGGPVISVADLVNDGLLPDGFRDRNVWGQQYRIYIRQPQTKNLQAVVLTTGGRSHEAGSSFGTAVVPGTAALLGGPGGFVPTGDIPGQAAGTLHGAGGGWVVSLGGLGIPSPGAGHLGALSTFDPTSLGQDQLYRVAVPGHPELNQMQTELDMTDHAVENVKEIQFVPHTLADMENFCASGDQNGRFFLHADEGFYVCRDGKVQTIADTGNSLLVKNMTLASHGQRISKPHCPAGIDAEPEIFLSPVVYATGEISPPITAVQSWATSVGAEWQVNLRLMTADPRNSTPVWVNPSPDYGKVMVTTICRGKE